MKNPYVHTTSVFIISNEILCPKSLMHQKDIFKTYFRIVSPLLSSVYLRHYSPFVPFHGLIRNGQTVLPDGVLLLSLSQPPVGGGVGEDGVRHRVRREALNAVLDVTDRELGLQEEVELAVRQTHCGVHHSETKTDHSP